MATAILSVLESFKPRIVSLPLPSAYSIRLFLASLVRLIWSLPVPALIVALMPLFIMVSSPPLPFIIALAPLFVIKSLPIFALIIALMPLFEMVSSPPLPLIIALAPLLLIESLSSPPFNVE